MGRRISKKEAQDVMDVLSNMDGIEFLGENRYGVPSQTVEGKTYTVVVGDGAQHCDCPGSRKGTHTCKHIRAARMFSMMDDIVAGKFGGTDATVPGPQRQSKLPEHIPGCCTKCLSTRCRKWGRRKTGRKGLVQTYKCYKCNTRFSADPTAHRLAVDSKTFALIVSTYFDGLSYKETSDHMKREGVNVSPSTVKNYVRRAVDACLELFQTLCPAASGMWSVDDLHTKVTKSFKKYFYCIMDHNTRFMLALREFLTKGSSDLSILFRDAKEVADRIPVILLSDADASIAKAARENLRKKNGDGTVSSTFHNKGAHIRAERTDNRQERLERTLARWARRFGFVNAVSNNRTRGMLIHYNFCRTHDAIGRTPAEEAGIIVEGGNKWETFYRNAAWRRIRRGVRASKKPRQKKTTEKCDKVTRWITGRAAGCIS